MKYLLNYEEVERLKTKNISAAATVTVEKRLSKLADSENFKEQSMLSAQAGAEKGPELVMGRSAGMLDFSWVGISGR